MNKMVFVILLVVFFSLVVISALCSETYILHSTSHHLSLYYFCPPSTHALIFSLPLSIQKDHKRKIQICGIVYVDRMEKVYDFQDGETLKFFCVLGSV